MRFVCMHTTRRSLVVSFGPDARLTEQLRGTVPRLAALQCEDAAVQGALVRYDETTVTRAFHATSAREEALPQEER